MEGNLEEMEKMKEPLLDSTQNSKGGFRTLPFIIGNEAFERVASNGISPNMILYLMKEYNMEMVTGNYVLNIWSAATNFTPIIGAFISDSFVGRFPMIGFGSIFSLLGMTMLWSTTMIPQVRPSTCNESSNMSCSSSKSFQLFYLCFSFGLMSIGAGGIRSSSLAFGADQLKGGDSRTKPVSLESYFGWYFACTCLAVVIALTGIVYIQDHFGWQIGFGVPVALMIASALSFFLASPFYIKFKNRSSFLTGFAQVIVASYRNRNITLPLESTSMVYHHKKGSALLVPSDKLRFLNKACIIKDPQQYPSGDEINVDSWNVCTVDQVEELKAVIKVIPIWSTGALMSINICQPSFPVIQAKSMDRHITSGFEIPAGSFGIFTVISITLWVVIYDRIILPLASCVMKKPVYFNPKQRMGFGILLSIFSTAITGVVEYFRRRTAINEGLSGDADAVVKMSAMWLIIPNCLGGFAEAVNSIGQNEFYFSEFPRSMSCIALTLQLLGMSAASLLATFIISAVDKISSCGGNTSWVSGNINEGHYDYYYWVLAGISAVNLIYLLLCSWAYGPCELERGKVNFGEILGDR